MRAWPGPRSADLRLDSCGVGPVWVRAHPTLLGELLDNLLDNACKYSETGTPVVVRAGREGGTARLAVEDSGVGIEPAEVSKIIQPFYRTAQARFRDAKGLGLGLSVASRIAETFAGRLDVESRPGRGSTFSLIVPCEEPPRQVGSSEDGESIDVSAPPRRIPS